MLQPSRYGLGVTTTAQSPTANCTASRRAFGRRDWVGAYGRLQPVETRGCKHSRLHRSPTTRHPADDQSRRRNDGSTWSCLADPHYATSVHRCGSRIPCHRGGLGLHPSMPKLKARFDKASRRRAGHRLSTARPQSLQLGRPGCALGRELRSGVGLAGSLPRPAPERRARIAVRSLVCTAR